MIIKQPLYLMDFDGTLMQGTAVAGSDSHCANDMIGPAFVEFMHRRWGMEDLSMDDISKRYAKSGETMWHLLHRVANDIRYDAEAGVEVAGHERVTYGTSASPDKIMATWGERLFHEGFDEVYCELVGTRELPIELIPGAEKFLVAARKDHTNLVAPLTGNPKVAAVKKMHQLGIGGLLSKRLAMFADEITTGHRSDLLLLADDLVRERYSVTFSGDIVYFGDALPDLEAVEDARLRFDEEERSSQLYFVGVETGEKLSVADFREKGADLAFPSLDPEASTIMHDLEELVQ